MKDTPIIFNREMVIAVLEDRKTQTRRIVKPQPLKMESGNWYPSEVPGDRKNHTGKHYANEEHFRRGFPIDFSPYGSPGDRLWVRETWATPGNYDHLKPSEFSNAMLDLSSVVYRATENYGDAYFKWRSPLFMPRWISRITLEIVNVRVERLQEITHGEAIAEGFFKNNSQSWGVLGFSIFWNSINSKPGRRWEDNPWVWVIEFKKKEGKS